MPVWQLAQVAIPTAPIVGPDGQVINANARPGTIAHWCDEELAAGWFAEAAKRASVARGSLNRNSAAGDDAAQFGIRSALEAVAYGFNACNVLWWTEPRSRGLYWKYVSGQPQARGGTGNALQSEFERFVNFSDLWYGSPNQDFPGDNGGVVTRQASGLWTGPLAMGSHAMQFVQSAGLWVQPTPEYAAQGSAFGGCDYALAEQTENVPAVGGFFDGRFNHCFHDKPSGRCVTLGGAPCDRQTGPAMGAARQMWFNDPVFGAGQVALQFSPPEMYYLPWLEEWTAMLAVTKPSVLIGRARTYVVYVNSQQAILAGGSQAFITDVINGNAQIQAELANGSTQTALNVAAAAAAGIGGALAAPTFGISAVVGGAAALVLKVTAAIATSPLPPGVGRDDLGRYKPVLEPGWLGGNPGVPGLAGQPTIDIPDPPGWTRRGVVSSAPSLLGAFTNPLIAIHAATGSPLDVTSPPVLTPTTAPASGVTMTEVLVGAGIAAALAGAVYVATRPAPRAPRTATRPRR